MTTLPEIDAMFNASCKDSKLPSLRECAVDQLYIDNVQFELETTTSSQRNSIEQFIANKYRSAHQATLCTFMPVLIAMTERPSLHAAIGLRFGSTSNFFLEQYTDKPIEQLIAETANKPISRLSIVEIGNFAVSKTGSGWLLISTLAKALEQSAYQWMVFTATPQVEKLIRRLSCSPINLCEAHADHLEYTIDDWGNYYSSRPKVMACNLSEVIKSAKSNQLITAFFETKANNIDQLSRHIRALEK